MNFRRLVMAIFSVTISLTGCYTKRPVDLTGGQPLVSKVAASDYVRVRMRDGSTLELQVTAVEPEALVSRELRVPRAIR